MTHTVILDEAERDRRMVNHLNEIIRHCRIGRVRRKAPGVFVPGQPIEGWPLVRHWKADPMKPAPTPFFSGGYVHTVRSGDVPA